MSLLQLATGGAAPKFYVDDVFSAYTYTGNSSTQTITNGIDLAGKGGMVWIKDRDVVGDHYLFDTLRGGTKKLATSNANEEVVSADFLESFNSNGFTLGANGGINFSGHKHASWTFRRAQKFFDVVTYTGNGVAGRQIAHSLGVSPGMVIIKATNQVDNFVVWHRSVSPGYITYLNTSNGAIGPYVGKYGNDIVAVAPTNTDFTVGSDTSVNQNGITYVAYLFAHDSAADGLIQCGSFTTDGAARADVTLGWEPQFSICKRTDGVGNWRSNDVARGAAVEGGQVASLYPNLSDAEGSGTGGMHPTATGFVSTGLGVSQTYIYLAIRRPNKPPTVGTQVYNAIARTGTDAAATVTGVGFAPDTILTADRTMAFSGQMQFADKLRGITNQLIPHTTSEEIASAALFTSFDMDGFSVSVNVRTNANTGTYANWCFRRAPGVFDQICYNGTGANKTEAIPVLGVPAELWNIKSRSGATEWVWGSSLIANTEKIVMPSPAGVVTDATAWNSTYPTATALSLGTAAAVNTSAATYTAYLWATLAGVSKVFTYTGDGTSDSSKIVDCGFAAGARFVMIIRTTASTAQDIFIWDTVRGIVAANDPHLSLNSTAAEVTTDDSIDPSVSGFIVNQVAATNINVNGAVYIGLAYA